METIADLGPEPVVKSKRAEEADQRARRQALQALSNRWGAVHKKRVDELTGQLLASSPDAPGDEALVLRLGATMAAIAEVLARSQFQVASRLEHLADDPKLLLAAARALREVTAVQAATSKSFEELLGAAATMRSQRALVRAHTKKETWHGHDGGGSFVPGRRDSHPRPAATN